MDNLINSMYNEYDHIISIIEQDLHFEEKLLFLGQSTKKESYYALVKDNQGRFNSFCRVSCVQPVCFLFLI